MVRLLVADGWTPPDVKREGEIQAQALEALAAEMESKTWDHKDDWGVSVIYPNALRIRAQAIREDRPLWDVYAEHARSVVGELGGDCS